MSQPQHEHVKLRRVLGFWPAYGAAVGLVVSGTAMVSVGNVAGIALKAAIITGLLALIPQMAAAFAFGELTAMLPGGGMISEYTMPALGRFFAIFSLLSGYIVLIACDGGTQQVIGGLSLESLTGIPQPIGSWMLLLLVMVINLLGVKLYGKTEAALTVTMMSSYLLLGILGNLGIGKHFGAGNPVPGQATMFLPPEGWSAVLSAVGIAIWWYIGFEFACPLAEENLKPWKNIPRALILGLISIYLFDVIFVFAEATYTPREILINSSIPHVEAARYMLGKPGHIVMTVLTIFAAFTTANAEMAALPRMLYGMARERLWPSKFAWIHPKYRTPWVGIFFTTGLMALTMLYATLKKAGIDTIMFLIMTACITWMVEYAIAMIDVIVLRKRYPDYPRLWKAPGGIASMIIGLIGTAYAIWTLKSYWWSAALYELTICLWIVYWLKRVKLPLWEKTRLEDVVKGIYARVEPEPTWDETVVNWLKKRGEPIPERI